MFIGMYGFPSADPCQQALLHEFCDQRPTAIGGSGLAEDSTMRAKTIRNLVLLLGLCLIVLTLGLTQALSGAGQDADPVRAHTSAISQLLPGERSCCSQVPETVAEGRGDGTGSGARWSHPTWDDR